jgi:uncharacterized protein YraI
LSHRRLTLLSSQGRIRKINSPLLSSTLPRGDRCYRSGYDSDLSRLAPPSRRRRKEDASFAARPSARNPMTFPRRDRLALALLTIILLAAPAFAATYRTKSQAVVLRASPRARSATLATLASGEPVEVSACSATWCNAKWRGRDGWIARRDLTLLEKAPAQANSGRGYRSSDGHWVPSPQQSPNGPPPGASAQCNDWTYSFSRHHSGTCSHHGGVRRWL